MTAPSDDFFESNIGKKLYDLPTNYRAVEAHFHLHSEHTIDKKQFDFEMHVVHPPTETDTDGKYGVIGVLFDRVHYDKNVTQR